MDALFDLDTTTLCTPVTPIDHQHPSAGLRDLTPAQQRWLQASGFEPTPGRHILLADADGALARVLVAVDAREPTWALAALPRQLPAGRYCLSDAAGLLDAEAAALGWALGAYRFERYRQADRKAARLGVQAAVLRRLQALIAATASVRDLVNTPTEDMGPEQLADAVRALAAAHDAQFKEWVGDDLLKHNFPTIHAVGRASHRAPRLLELSWGCAQAPRLTLVGKGVCFDTGGLDLKSSSGMRWMKKDMGGAAHAIALAGLVMTAKLPVRLSLLVPAVENAVAGNAMRPGEVICTRAGYSVEVDNTDAEGRLILCDALAYAVESKPELLIDFATLTGAARVALGPDLPALFSNRDALAEAVLTASRQQADPLWRLPLWQPYQSMLDSAIADFANSGVSRQAGAITAGLYLQRFVPQSTPWIHVDLYAWNESERPGRPHGGEAQSLRALFAFLRERFSG